MKFKQMQKILLLNAVAFIFLLTGVNIFTAATAGAATCFNAVQNIIAYDYKGIGVYTTSLWLMIQKRASLLRGEFAHDYIVTI